MIERPSTIPVPASRDQCPTVLEPGSRCRIHACRYNLDTEDEPPGKPVGGKRPPSRVVKKSERSACALEVADRGEKSTSKISTLMQISQRRVQQLLNRGALKMKVGNVILDHAEQLREKLPPGSIVESIFHSPGEDPGVVISTFIVAINRLGSEWKTDAVQVRKRIQPETLVAITRDEREKLRRVDEGHLMMNGEGQLERRPERPDRNGNADAPQQGKR